MKEVLEIQEAITKSARKCLEKLGFIEIVAPIIAPATDPGLRGAKHFEVDFYGKKYKLTGSMIMHKIAGASALGKVFALSPCLRKEELKSSGTGRHLAEFWQIDVELAEAGREIAMDTAERLLCCIIKDIAEKKSQALEKLGRKLKVPKLPFRRLTYKKAVELAKELGFQAEDGEEIPWEAEKAISLEIGEPFFITDYPRGSRGFYDRIDPKQPEKLLSFDLIFPEGFGEASSGSEREFDPDLVRKKLIESGEDPEDYKWFIELLEKKKILPTAGFGFGLERLTRFICGLKDIADATPFPKIPGGESI